MCRPSGLMIQVGPSVRRYGAQMAAASPRGSYQNVGSEIDSPSKARRTAPTMQRSAAMLSSKMLYSGGGTLPSSFRWSSSGILMSPKSDARHSIISVKDPSVVYYNGKWYVLMSTVDSGGSYGMAQASFTDWSQAANAPLYYLDQSAIGGGYKTATAPGEQEPYWDWVRDVVNRYKGSPVPLRGC